MLQRLLIKLTLLGTLLLTSQLAFAYEEIILRITGETNNLQSASQIDIATSTDFVKGVFNASPRRSLVELKCLESGDELLQPGMYEPDPCTDPNKLSDNSYDAKTGVAYMMGRNFGISSREYQADFTNHPIFVDGSAAHLVQKAIKQLETSNGIHKWRIKYDSLPDKVKYKAPGTGPHFHLGIRLPQGQDVPAFFENQNTLDIHAKAAVPVYKRDTDTPHASLTLVINFKHKLADDSGFVPLTLHIKIFHDLYKGELVEDIKTEGRNIYAISRFHPASTFGTTIKGETQNSPFSDLKNFRYSMSKDQIKNMLKAYNDYVGDNEAQVKEDDLSEFTTSGFSIRNEAQNLYNEKLDIQVKVKSIKLVRVY